MTRIFWMRGVNPAHVGSLFVLIFGLILTTFNLYKLSVLQQHFLNSVMKSMKAGQKVSKFPGTGFVTNKVNLATSGLDHIPQAWKIPADNSKVK